MSNLTNLTGTSAVDDSIIEAYAQGILVEKDETVRLEQFADVRVAVTGREVNFTKFGKLPKATTPLDENADIPRVKLADTPVVITAVEYGTAVCTTRLASLQTGGRVDLARVRQIGQSLGRTQDQLIVDALLAAPGSRKAAGTVSGTTLAALRLALAKRYVPTLGGAFVALMDEDSAEILRNEAGWTDVQKYSDANKVLAWEIGMYKGMKIVTTSDIPAGTVIGLGAGAIAKGVAEEARFYAGNPDAAGRFVEMGWHGVFKYQLIDTDNVQILTP
jgi:N4-gp56 family major capsid protein